MSSEDLHAPRDRLSVATLNQHQAIVSLKEEIEAVDWYRQRADDCDDPALKAILIHNMQEEIEHACMVLEWLRRHVPEWSEELDTYLYSKAPITEVEELETGHAGSASGDEGKPEGNGEGDVRPAYRYTVGSLKNRGA